MEPLWQRSARGSGDRRRRRAQRRRGASAGSGVCGAWHRQEHLIDDLGDTLGRRVAGGVCHGFEDNAALCWRLCWACASRPPAAPTTASTCPAAHPAQRHVGNQQAGGATHSLEEDAGASRTAAAHSQRQSAALRAGGWVGGWVGKGDPSR